MTYSRDKILKMSHNELNMAVAEHVFGWIAWEEKRGEYTYVVFQKPGEREPYKSTQKWESAMKRYRIIDFSEIDHMKHIIAGIKYWSSDISAAWKVVEKINESGWMLYKLANTLSGLGVIDGYICILLHLESGSSREDVSETVSEAICKAALLAVMEELPKGTDSTASPSKAAAETGLGGEQNNE